MVYFELNQNQIGWGSADVLWFYADEIYQAFDDFQSGKLQNPNDDVWAA